MKKFFKIQSLLFLGIVLLLTFLFLKKLPGPTPRVASSVPKPNGFLEIRDPFIQIIFDKPVLPAQQSFIKVKSQPDASFRLVWESPVKLSLIPSITLTPNEDYRIQLSLNEKLIFTLPFKTAYGPYSPKELDQQAVKQGQEDLVFNQKIEDLYKQLPFLRSLPITTPEYGIVYDYEKKAVRIRVKYDIGPGLSKANQLERIKPEILQKLESIGINTKTQPLLFIE